jgi:hypothetical protein
MRVRKRENAAEHKRSIKERKRKEEGREKG